MCNARLDIKPFRIENNGSDLFTKIAIVRIYELSFIHGQNRVGFVSFGALRSVFLLHEG